MKNRAGFVSNSSSSSFIIPKQHLTLEQRSKIINHVSEAPYFKGDSCGDSWTVEETDDVLRGYTYMDNFDMVGWMVENLGVNPSVIDTDEGHYWDNPFDIEDFKPDSLGEKLDTIATKVKEIGRLLGGDHPSVKELQSVVSKVRKENDCW
jgi:hypothetical protein